MSLEDARPPREPIFNIPRVVVAICALLLAIQLLENFVSPETYGFIFIHFAFVPGRFTFAFDPDLVSAAFNKIAQGDELRAQLAEQFLGDGSLQWWTFLTYAFLHGGWTHVGLNCLWLVAFGGAVAKRLKTAPFLALLAVCAIAGAIVHYFTHLTDLEPVVGASAAVSGAMGAASRFVFEAGGPLGGRRRAAVAGDRDDEFRQPALTLRQTLTSRRSLPFILLWFALNFVFGISGAIPGLGEGAVVAWEAHVGGFLAGLLLFGWFDPPRPLVPAIDEDA